MFSTIAESEYSVVICFPSSLKKSDTTLPIKIASFPSSLISLLELDDTTKYLSWKILILGLKISLS